MLYITTRNHDDVFTAHHALKRDRCECGGLYVPFTLNQYSSDELIGLKDKSFGQCIADVLNLFFSARLDGLDVDFCIGKNTSKLVPISHKIVIAENWHNSHWNVSYVVNKLCARIQDQQILDGMPSNWVQVAVRIALLFALYGEMVRSNYIEPGQVMDVAVTAGDFSAPMAVWYARNMGLPVCNIICGCNDDDSLWDLLHNRQLRTDCATPSNLERLIFATFGASETERYCSACSSSRTYELDEEQFEILRKGMFAAVVSEKRTDSVMRNVHRSASYLLTPNAAIAYGGLQDYRASTGEGRIALILTEEGPVCDYAAVAKATGLSELDIKEKYGAV